MKRALVLLLLTTAALAADPVSKVTGTLSVFHADGKDAVTLRDIPGGKTAHDQCFEAAKAFPGKSSCSDVFAITTTPGTCTDVAKPTMPRELDADGFVKKPLFRSKPKDGSDTEYTHEVEDFVAAPYPACWVKGWRVAVLEDWSGTDEDGPPVELADTWSPAIDVTWHNEVSRAARALNHISYPDDP